MRYVGELQVHARAVTSLRSRSLECTLTLTVTAGLVVQEHCRWSHLFGRHPPPMGASVHIFRRHNAHLLAVHV